MKSREIPAGTQVLEHVLEELRAGRLGAGQRLPSERELAEEMGMSRPSLRSGLRALEAMGVITSRRGAGSFVVEGPPQLGQAPLRFLAALHGLTLAQMREALKMLEAGAAALAAERATGDQIAVMAEELTDMFATLEEPEAFLRHELGFLRAVAAASGNPVAAAIIRTFTEILAETAGGRAEAVARRDAAETHRRIYQAIRARDPERARGEMEALFEAACAERVGGGAGNARPAPPTADPARAHRRIA
jgi:GntR family transcriptional repressor for pyruvate dehydrogenase complex